MCALCIDACDSVMNKLDRPTGLIRYESLDVLNGKENRPLVKRPRVWVYLLVLLLSVTGIFYGVTSLDAIEIKVIRDRQPLYVVQSDGEIQNRYTIKILNKMTADMDVAISAEGPEGLVIIGADKLVTSRHGRVTPHTIFIRVPPGNLAAESVPITFMARGEDLQGQPFISKRNSVFIGPKK